MFTLCLEWNIKSIITGVFKAREEEYIKNRNIGEVNEFDIPAYDLLNATNRLGLMGIELDMLSGISKVGSKAACSETVWERAWTLDDTYWRSLHLVHSSNDMLFCTMPMSKYLIW